MNTKPAFQYDNAGLFIGETVSHASPLEPGVFLLPARCTYVAPPADVPADKWPRWNGAAWDLVTRPAPNAEPSAVAKLQQFLAANPDVAALIQTDGAANV